MPISNPSMPSLRGCRILIVDDERLNLRILSRILEPEGYQIFASTSGEEALEMFPEVLPDLVLLDVMLAGISGFDTAKELRVRYPDKCPPIVFITARGQTEDILEGKLAGGTDYLPKPFRPREALTRLRGHLEKRKMVMKSDK